MSCCLPSVSSAALVGLSLLGAFVTRAKLTDENLSILSPMVFARYDHPWPCTSSASSTRLGFFGRRIAVRVA